MKSKILIAVFASTFTLLIFGLGFSSAFFLNYMSLANTYTKEHIDNGRFMLHALQSLEKGNIEQAKLSLRGHVSMKVLLVDAVKIPPTSQREIDLIEDFYLEVIEYFDSQGGFNETMQVMENGVWVSKPTPSMQILEDFAAK